MKKFTYMLVATLSLSFTSSVFATIECETAEKMSSATAEKLAKKTFLLKELTPTKAEIDDFVAESLRNPDAQPVRALNPEIETLPPTEEDLALFAKKGLSGSDEKNFLAELSGLFVEQGLLEHLHAFHGSLPRIMALDIKCHLIIGKRPIPTEEAAYADYYSVIGGGTTIEPRWDGQTRSVYIAIFKQLLTGQLLVRCPWTQELYTFIGIKDAIPTNGWRSLSHPFSTTKDQFLASPSAEYQFTRPNLLYGGPPCAYFPAHKLTYLLRALKDMDPKELIGTFLEAPLQPEGLREEPAAKRPREVTEGAAAAADPTP